VRSYRNEEGKSRQEMLVHLGEHATPEEALAAWPEEVAASPGRGAARGFVSLSYLRPYPALPLEQISHPRVAIVHPLIDLVGSISHVHKGHNGEYDHHREQEEAYEDDRK
jgi:hypothetical protein